MLNDDVYYAEPRPRVGLLFICSTCNLTQKEIQAGLQFPAVLFSLFLLSNWYEFPLVLRGAV